jgi:hypothetical protein
MKTKRKAVKERGLTGAQVSAMLAVSEGADVLSREIAVRLREVERDHPEFITIGKRMGIYDPCGQLPYFGAILTAEGRAAIGITDVETRASLKLRSRRHG